MRRTTETALPPYGPIKGMLDGLALVERQSPPVVDVALLKQHGIARANEYKVLHALRFLGLLDSGGRTTPESRLLRTRGPARTEALQRIVRRAYADLFSRLDLATGSRDDIHNYFVTRHNLSRDLAGKAGSFFVELCRLADLDLHVSAESTHRSVTVAVPNKTTQVANAPENVVAANLDPPEPMSIAARHDIIKAVPVTADYASASPCAVIVLTPDDVDRRSDDELATLFARVQRALARSNGHHADSQ